MRLYFRTCSLESSQWRDNLGEKIRNSEGRVQKIKSSFKNPRTIYKI